MTHDAPGYFRSGSHGIETVEDRGEGRLAQASSRVQTESLGLSAALRSMTNDGKGRELKELSHIGPLS